AAGAAGAATHVHRGRELASRRTRRLRARSRPDHGICAYALVLPDADLLSRRLRQTAVFEESDLCAGERLSRYLPLSHRACLRSALETVAAVARRVHPRPRLVL